MRSIKKLIIVTILSLPLFESYAVTLGPYTLAPQSFTSTFVVQDQCIVNTNSLAFGNYTVTTQLTANATITVTCTVGTPYSIWINKGIAGTSIGNRLMTNTGQPGVTLKYNLYHDAAFAATWGDNTGGLPKNGLTGNGAAQIYTVYGRIPTNQTSPIGDYSDTVTVSVVF